MCQVQVFHRLKPAPTKGGSKDRDYKDLRKFNKSASCTFPASRPPASSASTSFGYFIIAENQRVLRAEFIRWREPCRIFARPAQLNLKPPCANLRRADGGWRERVHPSTMYTSRPCWAGASRSPAGQDQAVFPSQTDTLRWRPPSNSTVLVAPAAAHGILRAESLRRDLNVVRM